MFCNRCHCIRLRRCLRLYPVQLKQILAVVALLLGMWISFYWHSVQYVTEIEEVDSALLTDDLPPDAFLDNDFVRSIFVQPPTYG